MHLTIYYRKGCFKSRFLRVSLKVMAWSVRELDAADPDAEAEMVQLKLKNGSGTTAIAPAIYNKDCLLYTSPSPRDKRQSRMPSSA